MKEKLGNIARRIISKGDEGTLGLLLFGKKCAQENEADASPSGHVPPGPDVASLKDGLQALARAERKARTNSPTGEPNAVVQRAASIKEAEAEERSNAKSNAAEIGTTKQRP